MNYIKAKRTERERRQREIPLPQFPACLTVNVPSRHRRHEGGTKKKKKASAFNHNYIKKTCHCSLMGLHWIIYSLDGWIIAFILNPLPELGNWTMASPFVLCKSDPIAFHLIHHNSKNEPITKLQGRKRRRWGWGVWGGGVYVKEAGLPNCEREGRERKLALKQFERKKEREWGCVRKREWRKAYVCLSCLRTALKHVRGLEASSLHLGVEFSEGKRGSEWKAFICAWSLADASTWSFLKVHAGIRGCWDLTFFFFFF